MIRSSTPDLITKHNDSEKNINPHNKSLAEDVGNDPHAISPHDTSNVNGIEDLQNTSNNKEKAHKDASNTNEDADKMTPHKTLMVDPLNISNEANIASKKKSNVPALSKYFFN